MESLMKKILLPLSLLFLSYPVFAGQTMCPVPYQETCFIGDYTPSYLLRLHAGVKEEQAQEVINHLFFPGVQFLKLIPRTNGSYQLNFKFVDHEGKEVRCYVRNSMMDISSYLKEQLKDIAAV